MKNLLVLSLSLFIAGCEITIQDPSMMEINGGSLTFKDKIELDRYSDFEFKII